MDPNETLRLLRKCAAEINDNEFEVDAQSASDLAELFAALDEWLKKGGFLPTEWEVARAGR